MEKKIAKYFGILYSMPDSEYCGYITEKETEHIMSITDEELYNYMLSLSYTKWWRVLKILDDLLRCVKSEYQPYHNLEQKAKELDAEIIYNYETKVKIDELKNDMKIFQYKRNLVEQYIIDIEKRCPHKYKFEANVNDNNIYVCEICGKRDLR